MALDMISTVIRFEETRYRFQLPPPVGPSYGGVYLTVETMKPDVPSSIFSQFIFALINKCLV